MRRFADKTKRIIAPVIFATMLPLCSLALALPRNPAISSKELKDQKAPQPKQITALRIRAAINLADGIALEQELCAKKFDVLMRRHKLIQKKSAKWSEKDMIVSILQDIPLLLEVSKHSDLYSNKDMQRIGLSSLRSNLHSLKSISKTNPRIVTTYLRTIGLLELYDLSMTLRQGFNNLDVFKIYQEMSADVCKQKR